MTPQPLPMLMVAPTGSRRSKADHPALPVTIAEIAETAEACARAGADGIHLHVRDGNGKHSLDAGLYREAMDAVGEAAPGLTIQITSEAGGVYGALDQIAMICELRPALVSVALREIIRAPADTPAARAFYHWAEGAEVAIQNILYTPDELGWFLDCLDDGTIPGQDHQLQFVLGRYEDSGSPSPADLDCFLDQMRGRNTDHTFDWMVCAFGPAETACLTDAVARGGKARVGFENSLWNSDGSLAENNAERVSEVRAAIQAFSNDQTLSPNER
ncbi:MAG: 3-keto-5-aminohexanoate cleavage protein [Paracoccaceae bacterium]|nr:3-keto-5-aminohexanoate cleavage protein [Paracoccaceae bacterium]